MFNDAEQINNPFRNLGKNPELRDRLKKKERPTPAPVVPTVDLPELSEEDAFLQAMSGVAPMEKTGRRISGTKPRAAVVLPAASFSSLLENEPDFEMEYTHEFVTGQIRSLDAKVFRKLKNGQFSVQGHLDLHGMNVEQAQIAVVDFVRHGYMEGKRCILLIPGRGLNSPQGQGVLRQELVSWLTHAPLKRIVLAFATAQPKHGGSGALYVLLRQVSKGGGKVVWEEIFTDFEG